MATFQADIEVMPLEEILDPQGKAVLLGVHNLRLDGITDARIGRHIRLQLDAPTLVQAEQAVETACQKLLANLIMEGYTFTLKPVA